MQTLWSRVAQAQAPCRCRICLHSTNALTRRSITAAPKRNVTVADIFTACYTTILGTAALVDARHKNERRRELDQQLDRARASLHQLAARDPQENLDDENGGLDLGPYTVGRLPSYAKSQMGNILVRPLFEELQSLCNIVHRPLAQQSWLRDQIDWADIEASVAAEAQDPREKLREPKSHGQLEKVTSAVVDLVDELVWRSEKHKNLRWQDETQEPDPRGESIINEIKDIRRGFEFPTYQFPDLSPSYSARVRSHLHESIRRIFNQATTTREIVGRICQTLLTAGVPPTIHTYNTLIAGFNRIQRPDLAQAVINSYLHRTRWPATNLTVMCLLNHYRAPSGREGMRDVVQRMRGELEEGLHLDTLYEERYGQRDLSPMERLYLEKFGRAPKVARNNTTFDRLIRGWLYHEELSLACMTFVASMRHGASLPVYTLQELFRGCLSTTDFSSARKVVLGIVRYFENFKWCLTDIVEDTSPAMVREFLQSLHRIIDICWLPMGEVYGMTYDNYAKAISSLRSVLGRLDVQLELRETARLPFLLSSAMNSAGSLLTRLELAISILDKAKLSWRVPTASDRAYSIVARLIALERRCLDLERSTRILAAASNAVFIHIKTGYDLDPGSNLLSQEYLYHRAPRDRRRAKRLALSRIDVLDKSLTIEDVASRLFHALPHPGLKRQLGEHGDWRRLGLDILVYFFGRYATTRRHCEQPSDPYKELDEQVAAAADSLRALVFSHIHHNRQKRAMYHYQSYYRIGLGKLVGYLQTDLKHGMAEVLFGETAVDNQLAFISHLKTLPPKLGQLHPPKTSAASGTGDSFSDPREDSIENWEGTRNDGGQLLLSALRKNSPSLNTALG